MFFLSIFVLKFLMTLARAICMCYGAARGHTTYGLEMRTWNNKGFSRSSTSVYDSSVIMFSIMFSCRVWYTGCKLFMQIRFSFPLVFVFDQRYVLKYADQSRLRFVVKNICIPAYSFVLVLRCRLTIQSGRCRKLTYDVKRKRTLH